MEIIVVIWLCFAAVGAMIGSKKGCAGEGFVLGLILGPFGVAFAWMMTGNRRQCPSCKNLVHKDALICPMCRSRLAQFAGGLDEATGLPTNKLVHRDRHGQAYESFDNGGTWRKA